MKTTVNPTKTERKVSPEVTKKQIENHKKTATHLEAAAKNHIEAAKHHEEENHEKAAKSTITAHGHTELAIEAQKEHLKLLALDK